MEYDGGDSGESCKKQEPRSEFPFPAIQIPGEDQMEDAEDDDDAYDSKTQGLQLFPSEEEKKATESFRKKQPVDENGDRNLFGQ